jgi:hypothetical protein
MSDQDYWRHHGGCFGTGRAPEIIKKDEEIMRNKQPSLANTDDIINVYKEGDYFSVAWKAYTKTPSIVSCDRCRRTNITESIHHGSADLCFSCFIELTRYAEQNGGIDNISVRHIKTQDIIYDDDNTGDNTGDDVSKHDRFLVMMQQSSISPDNN